MSLEDCLLSPLQKISRYPAQLSVRSVMGGGYMCGAMAWWLGEGIGPCGPISGGAN